MEKEIQVAWEKINNTSNGGNNSYKKSFKNDDNSRNMFIKKKPIINEDSLCQICNNGDSWDDNLIVFCAVRKKKKYFIFLNYFSPFIKNK